MLKVGTDLVVVCERGRFGVPIRNPIPRRPLFAPGEVAYCRSAPALMTERLATRFAATEATIKVRRPGDVGLDWHMIEVVADPVDGAPRLVLRGSAAALARTRGITSLALSLSHEARYASATVVAFLSHRPGRKTVRAEWPVGPPWRRHPDRIRATRRSPSMIDSIRAIIRDHARLSIDATKLQEDTDV